MNEYTEEDAAARCWTCGGANAEECADCEDGEEFCARHLAEHRALVHDQ
jgi:hypothetical protein